MFAELNWRQSTGIVIAENSGLEYFIVLVTLLLTITCECLRLYLRPVQQCECL